MNEKMFFKIRLYFTFLITIAIWSLLAWYHYHGGVPSHHILAREDLPEISNWWGGLLLPLLTWFLLYRVQKRLDSQTNKNSEFFKEVLFGFLAALLFGALLSIFFTLRYSEIPGYMLIGLLILAFFLPIYRAECLLGFVIGMTYTFGAILPTGIGSILALIGVVFYKYIRTAAIFVVSKLKIIK